MFLVKFLYNVYKVGFYVRNMSNIKEEKNIINHSFIIFLVFE